MGLGMKTRDSPELRSSTSTPRVLSKETVHRGGTSKEGWP